MSVVHASWSDRLLSFGLTSIIATLLMWWIYTGDFRLILLGSIGLLACLCAIRQTYLAIEAVESGLLVKQGWNKPEHLMYSSIVKVELDADHGLSIRTETTRLPVVPMNFVGVQALYDELCVKVETHKKVSPKQ